MELTFETFSDSYLKNVYINHCNVEADVQRILSANKVEEKDNVAGWLLKAISLIDLTTLAGDDTKSNVSRLCVKAVTPLSKVLSKSLGFGEDDGITTAAVCVYPSRVADAHETLKLLEATGKVNIAAVATGFPSGQFPLSTRLQEIEYAVSHGANEIDVVLDRSLVLGGLWSQVFEEVKQMKKACGDAHLKVILGVGELGTYRNVYKASMVSMFAGADFIKTSTGKEAVNATLSIGLVMCRAIRHYHDATGRKVGLKPAGGIKTARDAINWLILVHSELGADWLTPSLFRIGASSLLGVIEKHLYTHAYGVLLDDSRFKFI
ncbi:hypothetical protein JYU34_016334 [Plutella xylostella]|uniref:deoxyribose-phosphate aldolase n=1 Tax=Plutella xylostella TaxID=51655 RepID=A0ABQ7Q2C7_PLUXY|nr:hypothetical protein JYU34_016334 [Plutella xylostella]